MIEGEGPMTDDTKQALVEKTFQKKGEGSSMKNTITTIILAAAVAGCATGVDHTQCDPGPRVAFGQEGFYESTSCGEDFQHFTKLIYETEEGLYAHLLTLHEGYVTVITYGAYEVAFGLSDGVCGVLVTFSVNGRVCGSGVLVPYESRY